MLQVGSIIEVHGFVMLQKMNGRLKVSRADDISYTFTKVNGSKEIVRHYKHNVENWINNSSDINRIEIISY